ncbi:MAG: SAM-dependent methyltransferase [Bacteroidetes bacterium]|nr:SAM-dependent methyltransferase [Bacteroidota bacterium]
MSVLSQDISSVEIEPGSFRDPSGFTFTFENEIYRAIAPSYFENFSLLINSGLYQSLSSKKFVVKHSEIENFLTKEYTAYKVIKPEQIPFISYPYEWCFSQLQDAALLTLKVQKEALKHGMTLKDASAYNVQFVGGKPIFIDTLSFEKYDEGKPWNAYRQFCQHFLAPLALMSYKSAELSKLLLNYIDGIPLELASSLLPSTSYLNSGIAAHIIFHSKIQKKYSRINTIKNKKTVLPKSKLLLMIQHMEDSIRTLKIKKVNSNWIKYEVENTYSEEVLHLKEQIVTSWLEKLKPETLWDLGCNIGKFSLIASKHCNYILSMDADHYCIENFYTALKNSATNNILPLVIDLSNPSPSIGWANAERRNIAQRGKADTVLALALTHHIRIGNNIPFSIIARYFSELTEELIIEFIPKDDAMVQQMISGRENIFNDYTNGNFIAAFGNYFSINETFALKNSGRILYSMTKK